MEENPMITVYRITGISPVWTGEKMEDLRRTVVRRGGSLAYYESLPHAKRGLTGLKGSRGFYHDLRIEEMTDEWSPVNEV